MHLTLHLTDRCNLACEYCYARHGTAEMSFETAMAAIAECTADDPNPGIIFFGGEPLLKADLIFRIIDACEQAAPRRYHYKVTTNGTRDKAAYRRGESWPGQTMVLDDWHQIMRIGNGLSVSSA